MATQATPDCSPEYLSFQENFEALVSTFKAQPAAYADSLFSNGYIPDKVLEYSRLNGVMDSDKSRKILETITHRIENNPSVFHGFIETIAGPSTDDVVKKLHDSYKRHKTATSRVEQPQLSPPRHQQLPPEAPLPVTETMSDYLTLADLKKVYIATFEARNKWRTILLVLDVSSDTIDSIGTKWRDDPNDCFREGLKEWLKGGERSWEDVVKALSNPVVGLSYIAKTIKKESTVDQINDDLTIFLNEQLGEGAFGPVFKGSYRGEICAVKVLTHDAMEIQSGIPAEKTKAMDDQSEFLKLLQHPNLVQFLSTAKHPKSGDTILVVELMDCNLRSYILSLNKESLTSECEISLSKDVACGLAYIHSELMIHRNLCGDNVLLKLTRPMPIAKISDLGISRLYNPSKLTAIGNHIGYLPLKAIQLGMYNSSLDVFSLGAIMVQIVCKLETIKSMEDRSFHFAQIPHTHKLKKLIDHCLQEDLPRIPSARVVYDLLTVEATKRESKDTPPVNLTEEDSDALEKLLLDNNIKGFSLTGEKTYETVVHHLRELGHEELAEKLRINLDKVIGEQKRYLKKLDDLMTDEEAVSMQNLGLLLVGPPSVGKTTTLNRLRKNIVNITSDEEKAKLGSTLLANCHQVVAYMNKDATEWVCSEDVNEEVQVLFSYMYGNKIENVPSKEKTTRIEKPTKKSSETLKKVQLSTERQQSKPQEEETRTEKQENTDKQNKLVQIRERLQKLIKTGNYSQMASRLGSTLLHIKDVGGQPGFLEMLPAVSNGPALYLVFLDLSKELDEPYDIPFSRDNTIITPYKAAHTVEATVSQILSSIACVHHVPREDDLVKTSKLGEKFEKFQQIRPIAALIGTHVDKLENPKEKIKQVNVALKATTQKFAKILVLPPSDSESLFFAVDNFTGTEQSDIAPIRDFMSKVFASHFKDASLPIKPKWLLLGTLLRMDYSIVSMEDCLEIGRMLEMDEEDTKFCLRYLHSIGSLMHYTNVPDDWLKNHVFCTPEVIFTSISQLIIAALRILHSEGHVTEFEREELIKMGQFSLEAIIKYCNGPDVTKMLKEGEIIPAKQLIVLLQYLNLLSEIVHKDTNNPNVTRFTYLMPAILECAPQDELTNPPPPDANNPEPLHITFSFGYVPTGVFCGLITRLVSQGPHGILGLTWELVDQGVKRNHVSFYVDYVHKVTLLSHDRSYEIRVERNAEQLDFSLHDLCSHTLSAILYMVKILFPKLNLSVAFQCSCSKHATSKSLNNLCTLVQGRQIYFLCGRSPVTLSEGQHVWLGKNVCLGNSTELEVLKFAEDGFSFHWTKECSRRHIKTTDDRPNTVSFPSVREEDFGHYQCEVKDAAAGKVLLTVYRALYKKENGSAATQLATDGVPQATIESATAAQLSQECSDEALLQLSTEIAGYNDYKYRLGLSDAEIEGIDQNPTFSSVSGKFYAALKKWKSLSVFENPFHVTATYCRLVDIAKQLKDGTAIRNIHTACVKHSSRQ